MTTYNHVLKTRTHKCTITEIRENNYRIRVSYITQQMHRATVVSCGSLVTWHHFSENVISAQS